jgi:hypothetical protein
MGSISHLMLLLFEQSLTNCALPACHNVCAPHSDQRGAGESTQDSQWGQPRESSHISQQEPTCTVPGMR